MGKIFDFELLDFRGTNDSAYRFTIHLTDKNGETMKPENYYDQDIMKQEVDDLIKWITPKLTDFTSVEDIKNPSSYGRSWNFSWGKMNISYERRSFYCGILIMWNTDNL